MGHGAAELLIRGVCEGEQTEMELCLVKHTVLSAQRMAMEGNEVTGIS